MQKHHFHVVDALAKRKNPEDILGSASYRDNVLEPIVGDKAIKRGNARLLVHPHSFNFLSNIFRLTYVRNGQTVKASALRQRLLFTQAKNIARIHKKRLNNTVGGVSTFLSFPFAPRIRCSDISCRCGPTSSHCSSIR